MKTKVYSGLACVAIALCLLGCESITPMTSAGDAPLPVESKLATIEPADVSTTPIEQPGPTPVAPETQPSATDTLLKESENRTIFESDFGYTISYDQRTTDYRRTEGYDEFVLKSDGVDAPLVFVCISSIEASFVNQVRESALGESQEACVIGAMQLTGHCNELIEDWASGKVIHKTYLCMLSSGDAILIETQRYTQSDVDAFSDWVNALVDSIAA